MVNEKMTAIADKIRSLLGITEKMGLDAMATNLGTEQTNVNNAFTAVGTKGGTVPNSKISGNLASAIESIPDGVTVQRKTGTVSISGTDRSVECGFKPDAVFFTGKEPYDGSTNHGGVAFYEGSATSLGTYFSPPSTSYIMSWWTVTQTSTGFKVKGSRLSTSGSQSSESGRSVSYIAIKYT